MLPDDAPVQTGNHMKQDLSGSREYQRFWRALQQLGLNAYEARSYLVLLGIQIQSAGTRASRSVPRQKIYEVLDSLMEKRLRPRGAGPHGTLFRCRAELASPGLSGA